MGTMLGAEDQNFLLLQPRYGISHKPVGLYTGGDQFIWHCLAIPEIKESHLLMCFARTNPRFQE